MSLRDLISKKGRKRIAIIGMAKNVGKTTTLNHLQAELHDHRLGFVSIGRDGEPRDLVTYRRKPAIFVRPNSLVATAQRMGEEATAYLTPLARTSIQTPFGPVILYRVEEEGKVVLAGSRTGEHVKEILALMDEECDTILLDGALNRRRTATPILSDATILATGASLSSSIKTVIEKTRNTIGTLHTPALTQKRLISILEEYKGEQGILFLYNSGHRSFISQPSFYGQEDFFSSHIDKDLEVLYLSGALTSTNLKAITRSMTRRGLRLILPDATHIFVSREELLPFYRRSGQLYVLQGINLLALTVNPTSPIGPSFPASHFFKSLAKGIPDIPIFDLEAGFSTIKEKKTKEVERDEEGKRVWTASSP